jgi:hypothetical protein
LYGSGVAFESLGTSGVATISSSALLVDYNDQNPISGGIQGNAYNGVFSGGVQTTFGPGAFGNFGGVNVEAALDLYRIGSTTATAPTKERSLSIASATFPSSSSQFLSLRWL